MGPKTTNVLPLIGRKAEIKKFSGLIDRVKGGNGRTLLISGEPGIGKTRLVSEFLEISAEQGFNVLTGAADINSLHPFHLFTNALADVTDEPLFKEEKFTSFSEIFAVDNSGILLATTVSDEDEDMDGDIFAGMLSAVQNFVKDSFDHSGNSGGGLGRLEYGNMKILIEHGPHIYVAAVIKGKEHPEMKRTLAKTVHNIESEDTEVLESWSGDMDEMEGVQDKITALSDIKYTVRKDIEELDLENERRRIADRILELLYELVEEQPILLLLEDLQWADESSLFVYDYISRNIASKNIFTLGTRRPNESDIADKTIDELKDDGNLEEMVLSRLSSEDVDELMDELFEPNEFPEELGTRLFKECEGNPFFVIEMLKQMEQEGNIGEKDGVYRLMTDTYSIPTSVEEVVYRRLELLDPDALTMIEYASCEGSEINDKIPAWFDREIDHGTSMRALTDSGILISSDENYTFTHAIFRDVIYNSLSRWWKNSYHHRLGEFYENNYQDQLSEVYYDLARHFSNTNDYDKAHDYSYKAGEKAEVSLAPEQAIDFYESALYALNNIRSKEGKTEGRCELFERIGDMRGLLGDFDDALEYYNEGLEIASTDEIRAGLHRKLGHVFMTTGDYEKSLEECDLGLGLMETDEPEAVKLNRVKGRTYMRTGDYDKAMELLSDALELAKSIGDKDEIAEVGHNLGTVEWYRGNYGKALEYLEDALEIRKKLDDNRGVARTATNIGIVYSSRGDPKDALTYLEQALTSFEKIGDKLNLALVYNNMGMAYFKLGKLDEALKYFEDSLELFQRVGDKGSTATALNNLGLVIQEMGKLQQSMEYHERSLDIRRLIGDKQGIAMSLYNLGKVYMEKSMYELASKTFVDAVDICKEIGNKHLLGEILCDMSDLNLVMDNTKSAAENAGKALKLSNELGSSSLEGCSRNITGKIFVAKKDWGKAKEEFEKAKHIFEDSGEKRELATLFRDYGNMYRTKGEKERALEYYNRALNIQVELGLDKDVRVTEGLIDGL